jgi:short-subunit dehydrogenase
VREVARAGYEGMKQGKRLVIPGWKNRAVIHGLRLSPRSTATQMVSRMNAKKK